LKKSWRLHTTRRIAGVIISIALVKYVSLAVMSNRQPPGKEKKMKTHPNIKSYVHTMMRFIISIALMSPLAVGAHGADKEPRLKNNKTLTVIDANHKTVGQIGPFQGVCASNAVSYQVGGRIFSVGVDKTGFPKCPILTTSFFESTDCSGTPFVQVFISALVEISRVGEPGSTVYLPDLDNIQQNFLSHSQTNLFGGGCSIFDNNLPNAAPEIPIIDLDTVFTPPFKVQRAP
jgi:hypothetical protein